MFNKLNLKSMKKVSKLFLVSMIFPFILVSCSDDVTKQTRKIMREFKKQCPKYISNGIMMTDANFYEKEKILEFVASIENPKLVIDVHLVDEIKSNMVVAIDNEEENGDIKAKTLIEMYDYRVRYIYTDTNGNKLFEIEITKDDLP